MRLFHNQILFRLFTNNLSHKPNKLVATSIMKDKQKHLTKHIDITNCGAACTDYSGRGQGCSGSEHLWKDQKSTRNN